MKKYIGSCLCGQIQWTVFGQPSDPHLCYCQMCQKWSGAPVVAWVNFPLSSLTYTRGEPTLYRSSPKTQRGFCCQCGSTIFALDEGSDEICITLTTLEDNNEITPEFESFKDYSPKWLHTPNLE